MLCPTSDCFDGLRDEKTEVHVPKIICVPLEYSVVLTGSFFVHSKL